MISTRLSSLSAALLFAGGLALLFGADTLLPLLAPEFPAAAAWLGQALAAAWLALAALNWLSRATVLGGIYGRPVVVANAALYFITALVLVKVISTRPGVTALWFVAGLAALLAAIYGWLLLRGPLERDVSPARQLA